MPSKNPCDRHAACLIGRGVGETISVTGWSLLGGTSRDSWLTCEETFILLYRAIILRVKRVNCADQYVWDELAGPPKWRFSLTLDVYLSINIYIKREREIFIWIAICSHTVSFSSSRVAMLLIATRNLGEILNSLHRQDPPDKPCRLFFLVYLSAGTWCWGAYIDISTLF